MNLKPFFDKEKIDQKSHLALALSGGVDSMVLFHLLMESMQDYHFNLTAIHFNYFLRGEESNSDESFLREYCEKKNIPLKVFQTPLDQISGIQEKARDLRYKKMKEFAEKQACSHVFVAHHADDQLETVLMRSIRGAGERGLKGMDEIIVWENGVKLCRPLLSFSRDEIMAYNHKKNIPHREDSSNQSHKYFRNRVRSSLAQNYKLKDPHWKNSLKLSSEKNRKAYESSLKIKNDFIDSLELDLRVKKVAVSNYFQLDKLSRFLIIEELMKEEGLENFLQKKHFQEIEAWLRKRKTLFHDYGRVRFYLGFQHFYFIDRHEDQLNSMGPWTLSKNKLHLFEELGFKVQILDANNISFKNKKNTTLYLDFDRLPQEFQVRLVQKGDKFYPFGLNKKKKVFDYLMEKRIDPFFRRRTYVLEGDKEILAVLPHEINHKLAVNLSSQKVLQISLTS